MNKTEDERSVTFSCLKIRQPIGEFFIAVIRSDILCEIAKFDVRRVLQDERDIERYLGIQRPLKGKRVNDLEKYVRYFDATFPTSIIISVEAECAYYDENSNTMTLSNINRETLGDSVAFEGIARVLDGQHRIAGLFGYDGHEFYLTVTIFVGIDIADQAQIFSTVNLEQTKVNKSLAYDLFALAISRSPQKTCHNVAVALDQDPTSPFHKSIKRLGVATEGRFTETITQATFVESLLKYMSKDPRTDRDILLRGKTLKKANAEELEKLPLRNLFIEEKDMIIADLIRNYFSAVDKMWPVAWDFTGRGLMLNKTNGFKALMRVFRPAYRQFAAPGEIVETDQFLTLFRKSDLKDKDFTTDRFAPGTSGESELYRTLLRELHLEA